MKKVLMAFSGFPRIFCPFLVFAQDPCGSGLWFFFDLYLFFDY